MVPKECSHLDLQLGRVHSVRCSTYDVVIGGILQRAVDTQRTKGGVSTTCRHEEDETGRGAASLRLHEVTLKSDAKSSTVLATQQTGGQRRRCSHAGCSAKCDG